MVPDLLDGIPRGVVDVWEVDLEACPSASSVLSPEEGARARRFRRERDGRAWSRARGTLRRLLAGYLGADPRTLVLATESHGKPFLAEPASDLRFNVSHAGDVALLAFARGFEVGVDVELRSRPLDALALARRALGEEQVRELERLPPDRRHGAFLRAWVRHEAAVKCVGTGLGGSVPGAGRDVWLTDVDVRLDGVAALAARGGPYGVRLRRLPAGDP